MAAGIGYDLVLFFWRVVINLFFREIRPRGAFNIPRDGAVIFVIGPHHNQFLDPVVMASEVRKETRRRVAFITAAKSMQRFFIGLFARLMGSIPVARAADYAKTGSGKVYILAEDPLTLHGRRTKFTEECMVRGQIVLAKNVGYATGMIAEIISDTELKLKSDFIAPGKGGASDVKATSRVLAELASLQQEANSDDAEIGLAYKTLPHVEQHDMYGAVFQRLNEGGAIGIFPEGGSHDRTDLLPLKAGFALMALGAMSANPKLKIKIVPVGLSYFHPHKFRSRAVVEFGSPIEVPQDLVHMYGEGGAKKRDACGKLLEMAHDGLKSVTLRTPDFETLMVIQAGRRLYKAPGQHLSLGQTVELTKRFIEGYLHYQHEPRIIDLRKKITAYNRQLRDLGLRDHQVERATTPRRFRNFALLMYRSVLLLAWSILALPGVILHAPIFIPAKLYSHKKAKEALAASTVKIAGRDVLATWKVLFSVGATPVLYTIYAILGTVIAHQYGVCSETLHWMPLYIFTALPFFAMSALKFGEAGMDVFKSLRPLFLSLLPGSQKRLQQLKKTRENLSVELSDIINEFGPQLYENFYDSRLLPSASVPQTGETPGFLRRKTPAVDSSVLSHPMLWLDERIFGWSRSAVRGPSAWDAKSIRSEASETSGSPHESDDEELGEDVDYDDVLAIIDTKRSTSAGRARARSNPRSAQSYHDVQAHRAGAGNGESAVSMPPADSAESNELAELHRRRHRRTSSLNASIDLGQVAEAANGGAKTFDEMTSQLNKPKEEAEAEKQTDTAKTK